MMTSSRTRDVGGSFATRRGHGNQLSISDSSHHITETIGTLYGDDDDYPPTDQHSRPLSFISSPYGGEQIMRHRQEPHSPEEHRLRLVRSASDKTSDQLLPTTNGSPVKKSQTLPGRMPSQRNNSYEGNSMSPISPMSPTLRDMREEEGSQFPLGNIENPNDIALELSNLQALRRMSMDVSNTHDPDLLPFQGMSLMAMPSIAPQGDDDEADPSRLLWVPAGVHPELAPTEFKNFLEKRVQSMKRRSNDSSLAVDGLDRSDAGSLRRKKSMLSRQIDNVGGRGAEGYMDGAERLDRKKSLTHPGQSGPELSLDELVKDPTKAVQKLTLDTQRHEPGSDNQADDMPILPVAPGMGLRRSTRTTYRKGGSIKDRQGGSVRGERLPFAKRIAARKAEEDGSDVSPIDAPKGYGLARVQTEPITSSSVTENFSRPTRSVRRQGGFNRDLAGGLFDSIQKDSQEPTSPRSPEPDYAASTDGGRASIPIPQIIETPAVEDEDGENESSQYQNRPFPERSSSQKAHAQALAQHSQPPEEPPARSSRRPNYGQPIPPPSQVQQQQQQQPQPQPQQLQQQQQPQAVPQPQQSMRNHRTPEQTLNDMAQNPSPIPGASATRTDTDTLTFIPTFAPEERKSSDRKPKKDRSDSESSTSKPTGWKWFKSDDKEKKKKDDDGGKKSKAKTLVEKAHDNVRLDVLQTSIDTVKQKGRESLLLDRESIDNKLEEERKKESNRKSEPKKEKDGLFANLFGGGKKKGDRDSGGKKPHSQRPLTPEPAPYRPLQPDVDYHWTRFPILEERAIYRMAHIKLANPRRALNSQVLLSNFMYAYLAKVQAMHPQIQVPQSPQQKRAQEEERRRRQQQQQQEQQELQEQQYAEQNQAQDSIDRYNFEYHRSANQYGDSGVTQEGDYPEDAEVYDYEHSKDHHQDHDGDYRDDQQHDPRHDQRHDPRHDPRHDQRHDQRRDPRHDPRHDQRYDQQHDDQDDEMW